MYINEKIKNPIYNFSSYFPIIFTITQLPKFLRKDIILFMKLQSFLQKNSEEEKVYVTIID